MKMVTKDMVGRDLILIQHGPGWVLAPIVGCDPDTEAEVDGKRFVVPPLSGFIVRPDQLTVEASTLAGRKFPSFEAAVLKMGEYRNRDVVRGLSEDASRKRRSTSGA